MGPKDSIRENRNIMASYPTQIASEDFSMKRTKPRLQCDNAIKCENKEDVLELALPKDSMRENRNIIASYPTQIASEDYSIKRTKPRLQCGDATKYENKEDVLEL